MEKKNNIKIVRLKKIFNFFDAPVVFPFFNHVLKANPHIIHLQIPNPIVELYMLPFFIFKRKFKTIITYHAELPEYSFLHKMLAFLRRIYLSFLLFWSNLIIVSSPNIFMENNFLRKFKKKIRIVPFGVKKRLRTISQNSLRKKYKIKKDDRILLFVGRLYPYKGLEYLIKSIPQVVKKIRNVKLVIVGSGKLEAKLRKLAKEMNIEKNIIFTGSVSEREKNTFYKICDVFLLPSIDKGEAFGISMVEAMSFGAPLISTKIKGSGITFVNKDGETGVVVQPKSSNELAKAILKLLTDEKLRKKLGKNARKRFLKFFTLEKMVLRHAKLYKELIKT